VRVGLRLAAASVEGEHWRTDCSYPCKAGAQCRATHESADFAQGALVLPAFVASAKLASLTLGGV
jgi:hypothetical protein